MPTIINLIGGFLAGYGLAGLISNVCSGLYKWRKKKLNKKVEHAERSLTKEEKDYCRDYYEAYQDDESVINLDFDSFKSYYSLNPSAWLLMDYFAYREKPDASEFAVQTAKEKYSRFGREDPYEQIKLFIRDCDSHYRIYFKTVQDYFKYVSFRKDKERREAEAAELERQAKRNEAQKKLTTEFLEAVQADIDHIRQLSEEEYGQALDTISEVSSRMNVKEPVIQRPSSLGGVRQ